MSPHCSHGTHLMDQLEGGIVYRLVLIVAPSGSGKTAFLRNWARQQAQKGRGTVAWVSLEEGDNEPERFLADIKAALDQKDPPALCSPLSGTTAVTPQSIDRTLEDGITDLINELAANIEEKTLVLDNYQAIFSPAIHAAVDLMLDYLPPQAHLIIASRVEPPLHLPRLRVRRQLLELGPTIR